MSDFLMCPLGSWTECQGEECAWYDEVDHHCAIVTIADSLANIHGHAREMIARAYEFDEALEDLEDEEEKDADV